MIDEENAKDVLWSIALNNFEKIGNCKKIDSCFNTSYKVNGKIMTISECQIYAYNKLLKQFEINI